MSPILILAIGGGLFSFVALVFILMFMGVRMNAPLPNLSRRAANIIVAVFVFLVLLGAGAYAYQNLIIPASQGAMP